MRLLDGSIARVSRAWMLRSGVLLTSGVAAVNGASVYWKGNSSGSWESGGSWEGGAVPVTGANVFLVRNQTSQATVSLGSNKTIGNLTIGSENGVSGTSFLLSGAALNFVSGSSVSSGLTHLATARTGDTISSNIIFNANELSFTVLSANALLLNGALMGNQNLSVVGGGILAKSTTSGNGIRTTGNVTVSGATLQDKVSGGNGIYNTAVLSVQDEGNLTVNATGGNGIYNTGVLSVQSAGNLTVNMTGGTGIYNAGNGSRLLVGGKGSVLRLAGNGGGIDLMNEGFVQVTSGASVVFGNASARFVNSGSVALDGGNITGPGNFLLSGSNARLSGIGHVGVNVRSNNPRARISAGLNNGTAAGTLFFDVAQDWSGSNGLTIEFKVGNAIFGGSAVRSGGGGNDYYFINGGLTLNASASYTLELSTLQGLVADFAAGARSLVFLTSTGGVSGFNAANWSVVNGAGLLSALNMTGSLSLRLSGSDLVLALDALLYSWKDGAGSGSWTDATKWETGTYPDAAGLNVFFTQNQSGVAAADLGGASRIVGNLTIGSENASSAGSYALGNGTIVFNGGGSSTLRHSANGKNDVIGANISLANDLSVEVLSNASTSELLINGGTQSLNGHMLTKTGNGVLTIGKNSVINGAGGNVSVLSGTFNLDGVANNVGALTIAGGAVLGGNGTLGGNLVLGENAIVRHEGRLGAKYNDRFVVNGDVSAVGNVNFYELGNLTTAVGGGDRFISGSLTGIDVNGVLALNASADYTLNLSNISNFDIVDWTQKKDDNGIYYRLVTATEITGFDAANWTLNWGTNAPPEGQIWDLVKTEQGGLHTIWLHYANPQRIPEPGTYGLLTGIFTLIAVSERKKWLGTR